MKTFCSYFICAAAMQLFTFNICNAQATIELKPAPAGVLVDGVAKEWGDFMTDSKTKISYIIANDKDNLYLVVKATDPVQQSEILGSGVTLSIDPKGKKKSTYVVTFPKLAGDDHSMYLNMKPQQIPSRISASNYAKIKVEGFKEISEDEITTINTQGIRPYVGYDPSGYVLYEVSIPLFLFHADPAAKEWAFNIKINAIQGKEVGKAPLDGGGMTSKHLVGSDVFSQSVAGGMVDLTQSVDFWGKFTLAK